MRKSFVLINNYIIFKNNNKKVFRLEINNILGFSDCLPWENRSVSVIAAESVDGVLTVKGLTDNSRIKTQAIFTLKEGKVFIKIIFENVSDRVVRNSVMQFGIDLADIQNENITIPHNVYNDNPGADPKRLVPHVGKIPGKGLIVEEHRLPIPAANVEWTEGGEVKYVTLFSIPETGDCEDDKYWSLGVVKTLTGVRIQALSGQTMFNGIKDMVYAGKNSPVPFERGYKTLFPGQRYEKNYCLDFGFEINKGQGFRNIIKGGFDIFKPENIPAHSREDVVSLKSNCLDTRFYTDNESAGYLTFGSANSFGNKSGRPDYYLYGWTGEALKLAWCDIKLGLLHKDKDRVDRAVQTVDFYARNGESNRVCGMRYGYYLVGEKKWAGSGWDDFDHFSSRIQGEAVYDLLDIMLLLREEGMEIPKAWEAAVERACLFIMDSVHQTELGLYPLLWDEEGNPVFQDINSSGISCIIALSKAYEYFEKEEYLKYAEEKLQLYYKFQMAEFKFPFSRATMDARCEDKEAGMYFFLAAYELYLITGEDKYREWTAVSGDWILTFVFFWETGFKKGSYYDEKGFKTTGWPGVSVQNHHLDVFFPCFEMYKFGRQSNNALYEHMGKTVFNAFTHGICTKKGEWGFDVIGEQTEQFYQTNFFMSNYPELLHWVKEWRHGIRIWNPSWIIAQVLKSGIEFMEEGREDL